MKKKNKIWLMTQAGLLATPLAVLPLVSGSENSEAVTDESIPQPSPDYMNKLVSGQAQYANKYFNDTKSNIMAKNYSENKNNNYDPKSHTKVQLKQTTPQDQLSFMNEAEQSWEATFDTGQDNLPGVDTFVFGLTTSADMEFIPGSFYITVLDNQGNVIQERRPIDELKTEAGFFGVDSKGQKVNYAYPYSKDTKEGGVGPIKYGTEAGYLTNIITSNSAGDNNTGDAYKYFVNQIENFGDTDALHNFNHNFYTIGRVVAFYSKTNKTPQAPKLKIEYKTRKYASKAMSAFLFNEATSDLYPSSDSEALGQSFVAGFWNSTVQGSNGYWPKWFLAQTFYRTKAQNFYVNANLKFNVLDGGNIPETVQKPKFQYKFAYNGNGATEASSAAIEFTGDQKVNTSKTLVLSFDSQPAGNENTPTVPFNKESASSSISKQYNSSAFDDFFVEKSLTLNKPIYTFNDDIVMHFSNAWYAAKVKLLDDIKKVPNWSDQVKKQAIDYLNKNQALKFKAKNWSAGDMLKTEAVLTVNESIQDSKLLKGLLDNYNTVKTSDAYRYASTALQNAYEDAITNAKAIFTDNTYSMINSTNFDAKTIINTYNALVEANNNLNGVSNLESAKNTISGLNSLTQSLKEEITNTLLSDETITNGEALSSKVQTYVNLNTAASTVGPKLTTTFTTWKTLPVYQNASNKTVYDTPFDKASEYFEGDLLNKLADSSYISSILATLEEAYKKLDGNQRLIEAQNKAIEKLNTTYTSLNDAQKKSIISQIKGMGKISEINDSDTMISNINNAMKELNDAYNSSSNVKNTPDYKFTDSAKQSNFDNKLQDASNGLSDENLNPAEIKSLAQKLTEAKDALDGQNVLDKQIKAINGLSDLTPQEKENFISQANQASNATALQGVVDEATAANTKAKELKDKKEELKTQLEGLTNLTPEQIATAKSNIDKAADTTAAQQAFDNAKTLDTSMKELKELVNEAPTVKASSNYLNATNASSYDDAISNGNTALENANLTQEEVAQQISAIKQAKEALNGDQALNDQREAANTALKNATHLNEAQKQELQNFINSSTSASDLKNKINDIQSLDNKMAELQEAITNATAAKETPNYKNATAEKSTALNEALQNANNDKTNNLTPSQIDDLVSSLNNAVKDLDGKAILDKAIEKAIADVDKFTYLSPAQKQSLKERISNSNDVSGINGLLQLGQAVNDAMKSFSEALENNAQTSQSNKYKYADPAKKSAFDDAYSLANEKASVPNGVTSFNNQEIIRWTNALNNSANALDGDTNLKNANDTISALQNLSEAQKSDFKQQLLAKDSKAGLDEVVKAAQDLDAKILKDAQDSAIEEINKLTSLTDNQKNEAIKQVQQANNVTTVKEAVKNATDLNTEMKALRDLITEAPEIKQSISYTGDPAHQGAYDDSISNAETALKDTAEAPLSIQKAKELINAITTAKEALDGDKKLKEEKENALRNLEKLTNLTPEQKSQIVEKIKAATSSDKLQKEVENANVLNTAMQNYNNAVNAVNKQDANYKLAGQDKQEAVNNALNNNVNNIIDPATITQAAQAINQAQGDLNGNANKENALGEIAKLANLSQGQKDNLTTQVSSAANLEDLNKIVANAKEADATLGQVKTDLQAAKALQAQLTNTNNVAVSTQDNEKFQKGLNDLTESINQMESSASANITPEQLKDIQAKQTALNNLVKADQATYVVPTMEQLQSALDTASQVNPSSEALNALKTQAQQELDKKVVDQSQNVSYPNNVYDTLKLINDLNVASLRGKINNAINALPESLKASKSFKKDVLNNVNATVSNPDATLEQLQNALDSLNNVEAKEPLYNALDQANNVEKQGEALKEAIKQAQETLTAPENASKDNAFFQDAANNLLKAIAQNNLKNTLEDANNVEEPSNALTSAISNANDVINNPDSTPEQITAANDALVQALKDESLNKAKQALSGFENMNQNKIANAPTALQNNFKDTLQKAKDALAAIANPATPEQVESLVNAVNALKANADEIDKFPDTSYGTPEAPKTYVDEELSKLSYLSDEAKASIKENFNKATTYQQAQGILENAKKQDQANQTSINNILNNLSDAVSNNSQASLNAAQQDLSNLQNVPANITTELNNQSEFVSQYLNAFDKNNILSNTNATNVDNVNEAKNNLVAAVNAMQPATSTMDLTAQLSNQIASAENLLRSNSNYLTDLINAIQSKDKDRLTQLAETDKNNINPKYVEFAKEVLNKNYLDIISKEPNKITKQDANSISELLSSQAFKEAPEVLRSLIKNDIKEHSSFPWWAYIVIVSAILFILGTTIAVFKK
ncbi:hypothetical protein ACXYFN_03410 [Mycoplasma sp. 48589B]